MVPPNDKTLAASVGPLAIGALVMCGAPYMKFSTFTSFVKACAPLQA